MEEVLDQRTGAGEGRGSRPSPLRWLELALLFFGMPTLFAAWRLSPEAASTALVSVGVPEEIARHVIPRSVLIPSLLMFAVVCTGMLLLDRTFDKRQLWNAGGLRRELPRILRTAAILLPLVTALVWVVRPDLLFGFARREPVIYATVMVLYPIFSVYPQGLLYRAFFFHRYGALLGTPARRVGMAALAFGYMHIVFLNWISPLMCLIGGLLFSATYERSRSSLAASAEHTIYGWAVWTLGIGIYFYGGANAVG